MLIKRPHSGQQRIRGDIQKHQQTNSVRFADSLVLIVRRAVRRAVVILTWNRANPASFASPFGVTRSIINL